MNALQIVEEINAELSEENEEFGFLEYSSTGTVDSINTMPFNLYCSEAHASEELSVKFVTDQLVEFAQAVIKAFGEVEEVEVIPPNS